MMRKYNKAALRGSQRRNPSRGHQYVRAGPYACEHEQRDTPEGLRGVGGTEGVRDAERDVEGYICRRSEEGDDTDVEGLGEVSDRARGGTGKPRTIKELIVPSSTTCVATRALASNDQKSAATTPACSAVRATSAVEPCVSTAPLESSWRGRERK